MGQDDGVRSAVAIALLCVMALSVGGCGRERTGSFDLTGTLRLLNTGDSGFLTQRWGPCAGAGQHDGIIDGAAVTISDGTDTVAVGALSDGTRISATECDWTIRVADIPAGRVRYTVTIGDEPQRVISEGDLRRRMVMIIGG